MKILFVHNEYQQRGGEDIALQLEQDALLRRGHEVYSIVFSNKWESENESRWAAAKNAIYNKSAAELLKDRIDETNPDLVHVHNIFFRASPSILYACEERNVPVVMTLHNYRLICANALLLRYNHVCENCVQKRLPLAGVIHKCYRNSFSESLLVSSFSGFHKLAGTWKKKVNQYIVLTEFAKQKMLNSSLGLSEEQIVVKPNYTPDLGIGVLPRENYYLFVGRLSTEKGIESLLEASVVFGFPLKIAGDGPQQDRLVSKYSAYSHIQFLGKQGRTEVLSLMKKCKAFIFPSIWYEGLPYTIIEAFSTGTPVLSSNLGAMKELIVDNYNGFHFGAGEINSIGEAVKKFDQLNPAHLYEGARKSYEENYTVEKHYDSILKIYQPLINGA